MKKGQSRIEIIHEFCSNKTVLDIGCIQHNIENTDKDSWLHKAVIDVAADTLGVDYLEKEVSILAQRGYKIVKGDVNQPLEIDRQFDVILVGNLIEHVTNFEGLLKNIRRLIKPSGVVLISTANPFFISQYFYSVFKNDIIVNPEHTCWICPVTLDQLCRRFGLLTTEVRWVKNGWELPQMLFNGERQSFDIHTGRWNFHATPSLFELVGLRSLSVVVTNLRFLRDRLAVARKIYEADFELERYLLLVLKSKFVNLWWVLHRWFIPTNDINRFELYMSVLRVDDNEF